MDIVTNPASADLAGRISARTEAPVREAVASRQAETTPTAEFQETISDAREESVEDVRIATQKLAAADERRALEKAETAMDKLFTEYANRRLEFDVDEDTGKTVIKLYDKISGEVVRQIPPQEFLDMVSALNKVAQNLIKDLPKYI